MHLARPRGWGYGGAVGRYPVGPASPDGPMLEPLFQPRSIAVVGASRTPGKVGHEVLLNLIRGGYGGLILPVNPHADELLERPCIPSLSAFPGHVDLALVCVPAAGVEDVVRDALARGVGALVIVATGFRESGPEGAALEARIVAMARERGVPLLGPNAMGLVNPHHQLNASFSPDMPAPGGISVVAQSGAICTVFLDWAVGRGLGLAKLVSIGNKADLDEVDMLRLLGRDASTKVIVGYLEDISDGSEFVHAAEAAASVKPVVLLKVGTTEAGKRAASSHTGTLMGADIAYGAAFTRAGVIRAPTFESVLDYATAFSMQPLPRGRCVAVVTNAGGLGIIAADHLEELDLEVARLRTPALRSLRDSLPPEASLSNPVDILDDASPSRYALALQAVAADDGVDAVLILLAPQAVGEPVEVAQAVAAAAESIDKPVLASFMGGPSVGPARDALIQLGIPDFPSVERAVAALKAMWDYAQWRDRPPRIVERFPVNRRRVERILSRQVRLRRAEVGHIEAKQILRACDFGVPDGALANSDEEAVDIARRVGFPVAMKIASPELPHKSDIGGVRLHLGSPDAVRDAYDLMMLRISRRQPTAQLDGVYVEQMTPPGREVIIGMSRDPQFGPMLMFGLGGIFVEIMKDVTFHLAPITAVEAMEMLVSTRSYGLLKGTRGREGVDMRSIARGLQRISQLVTDFPQITELDIDPFVVGPKGAGAHVADARMRLDLERLA